MSGVALATAACTDRSSAARVDPSSTGQRVVVSNHPLYIDAATNPGFTAATGTVVEYHEDIVDEDEWLASLGAGPDARLLRDVVIVSDWAADRLFARNLLAPTEGQTGVGQPHVGEPATVVWAQGMVGIAYDAVRVDARVGHDVHTIAELFRPPLHGRVALPTDMRLTLGMALLADGVDPSDPAAATIAAIDVTAGHLVNSVRLGQVDLFPDAGVEPAGAAPLDRLLRGDIDATIVRASDVVGLERDHPDLRFVIPDEGGLLLTDVAVVSFDTANPVGANAYLDYVAAPDHAADRYRALPVMWPPGPVDDILRRDPPQADPPQADPRQADPPHADPPQAGTRTVDDPRRNPPAEVRARLRSFRSLDEAEVQQVRQSFDRVLHATG